MCAGDFTEAYASDSNIFEVVVTVFFLDTATNPIDYIHTIHRVLTLGGVWINHGPLTYHFEDATDEPSLELPFDQIMRICEEVGFRVDKRLAKEELSHSQYTCNQRSMLHYNYNCCYFICTKLEPNAAL